MRLLYLLFLVLLPSLSFATVKYPEISDWEIVSKTKDSALKTNRTRITFLFSGVDFTSGSKRLVWSANKFIDTTYISLETSLSKVFISGNYNFKFYINKSYREIIIPKLYLDSQHSITVQLNFKSSERENMMVKKPVIYLYPDAPSLVNVQVRPKGEMTFSYPTYEIHGWDVTANPNGELSVNDEQLNYLFWEAEQDMTFEQFDLSKGTIVSKEHTVNFLRSSLTAFGMNSKEQADFITFWGPILSRNDQNFIHFVINQDAALFADLQITPQPEHVNRIYLVFFDAKGMKNTETIPQVLPVMLRDGFTVLEWGGVEIINPNL